MKPTLNDIRYSPILSNLAVAYENDKYVAEQVLPVIQSSTRTGKYFKFDKGKFRRENTLRGMGSKTSEVGHLVSQPSTYTILEHALKEPVPDEMVEQAPEPLRPMEDATENVTEKLLVEKEYDLADYMINTLSADVTLSGTDQWSDFANSDPIGDVKDGKQDIHSSIFKDPNVLLLGKQTYDELVDHPDVIDRIKYSQFGVTTTELLARLFDVERVIIGGAGYNSAAEGASDSMSYIWGKNAWLLYVEPNPSPRALSFGWHFQLKTPRRVDRWYDTDRKSTYVRVTDSYTREFVSTDCAYFIADAVA